MKYIKYTFVDAATKKPVSEEGARRGPTHPEGVTPTFALEGTFSTGIPTFYGIAEDTYEPPYWMNNETGYGEIEEEEFFRLLKAEFNRRSRERRERVEAAGIYVDGNYISSTISAQNRIANMIAFLDSSPGTTEINYEIRANEWIVISREQAKAISAALGRHVQDCFNWCKGINEQVAAIETLEDAGAVSHAIASWNGAG